MSFLGKLFGWDRFDEAENRERHKEAMRQQAYKQGWLDWYVPYSRAESPYDHAYVWMWRTDWADMPSLVEPHGLDPAMNVIGLLWKPAVITNAQPQRPSGQPSLN